MSRAWVGINIDHSTSQATFLDGTVVSIKAYDGEDPSDDEDLYTKWDDGNPSNTNNEEDHVEILRKGSTGEYLLNDIPSGRSKRAACQKANPHCHEGMSCYKWFYFVFISHVFFCCCYEFNKIQGVTCPDIPNASYNFTRSYLDGKFVRGTQITYECADGYISTLDDNSVECTSNGWSENAGCVKGAWYIFKVRLKKLLSVK